VRRCGTLVSLFRLNAVTGVRVCTHRFSLRCARDTDLVCIPVSLAKALRGSRSRLGDTRRAIVP
jgi:hypothetical protein